MKKTVILLWVCCALLISTCIIMISKGFDAKNNYIKNENEPITKSKNVYVGGDAYNYIINGTYFTGYMVVGGAAGLCSIILFCTSLNIISQNRQFEGLRALYSKLEERQSEKEVY